MISLGMGLNCTMLLNCTRGLNCTKTKFHKAKFVRGNKLLEDDFAPRVSFERVTFLHENKEYIKNS